MYAIHFLFSFISTVAFGIITNIPKRSLLATGLTGAIGWMVYWLLRQNAHGLGFSNFVAAIAIGCLSIFFSRRLKMPMIIFNIPSLVPLVPGGPAYQAIRELVLGDSAKSWNNLKIVIMTAGAIAAGFMITSLVETLVFKFNTHIKKASQK
ncbi:membrane protein [Enterococcus saigonensis]|uniref:Membrane protein n=2 Tax=Enterococcus saigonensis TaxID=1805431 RepID=A0A679IKK7_9ENTE|nr:membrane protein [Enterococcus saigonensis]